jgi:hypothetical protein
MPARIADRAHATHHIVIGQRVGERL